MNSLLKEAKVQLKYYASSDKDKQSLINCINKIIDAINELNTEVEKLKEKGKS